MGKKVFKVEDFERLYSADVTTSSSTVKETIVVDGIYDAITEVLETVNDYINDLQLENESHDRFNEIYDYGYDDGYSDAAYAVAKLGKTFNITPKTYEERFGNIYDNEDVEFLNALRRDENDKDSND